jgi:transcription initiation factor TFIIE subunit alpha
MLAFIDDEKLMKVVSLFGEDALRIVKVLKKLNEATDDDIVTRTEIRLNEVRKILYQLYEHSLVSLRRSRDKETGWFVFHWRLQPDQIEGFILNNKRRVFQKLEAKLRYEKNNDFYFCKTPGCKRLTFEEAMEYFFRCPKCDKQMDHFKNDRIVENLTKKIEQIGTELNEGSVPS